MTRKHPPALALAAVLLLAAGPAAAAEPLVEQVRKAIDSGVQYLRQQEAGRGHWEVHTNSVIMPGGNTCLAMLALLNCGVDPDDKIIQRGLNYLRGLEPQNTYVVGLQTMVLHEAGFAKDLDQIQKNADWLLRARIYRGGVLYGWSYGSQGGRGDNSNTQYALLGLHAAKQAGAKIPEKDWKEIRDYYVNSQAQPGDGTGGWGYQPRPDGGRSPTSLTMTVAGLCGLYIAGEELHEGRQQLDPNTGVAARCNVYEENKPIAMALNWLAAPGRFSFEVSTHTFYNIYGIERAGRLSGRRFLGGHDWYREGCKRLVTMQHDDGSFYLRNQGTDSWPIVSTSFALLFLSKGRTPILISKFAHGWDDDDNRRGGGWNNKRHDVKHLAEFASRELFGKHPLAWQIYDPRHLELNTEEEIRAEVEALLQSPILYLNGHHAPRLTDGQKKVVKRYVEEGGFLLAEACCGSQEFADGFRELMKELFGQPMRELPPEHPVWTTPFLVPPDAFGEGRKLEGIDLGCKTVVVFSPFPLAGYWEEKRLAPVVGRPATTRPEFAYRLAGNIIAYATGMELPRPRLTEVKIAADDKREVLRSYLKVAQIKHEGDWEPAPRAMRNLMFHVREQLGLDVALNKEVLGLAHPDVFAHKLLYMHGRNRFEAHEAELSILRANLETGGVLFADACCGRKEFDAAFRDFVQKLFPKHKLERIPLDDYLFSKELNGEAIRAVKCRREKPDGTGPETDYRAVPPFLEGIRIDGRWVVIYSKYDVGCALEKHKGTDCLGHDHDSALKLGTAVVLYTLKK
ncbi:MAG TPA: DUF4159 domain-containing protein [Gemmataceae bacterium]